ncbi:MAG: carbohydrate ABC transporter permease [Acutalibacteraceae bacterium]
MIKLFDKRYALANKRRVKDSFSSLLRLLFIIGVCYMLIFPIFYMCITAFQSAESAFDPTVIYIPKEWTLDNLKVSIDLMQYWKSFLLTLVITVGSTLAALISCSLTGYGLARFKFPGRSLVFGVVILTIIIPPQVMFSSNYLMYRFFDFGGLTSLFGVSFNILETPWVFILPAVFATGLRNGIFIFVFYSFFKGLPYEMEEAAKIDGCGVLRTYIQVMAPMAVPAFATVMLFSIVWHWTDYSSSATYFTQDVRPLVPMLTNLERALELIGLTQVDGEAFNIRSYIQAGCFLIISPLLILYCFTQKFFTESIERTGLVG